MNCLSFPLWLKLKDIWILSSFSTCLTCRQGIVVLCLRIIVLICCRFIKRLENESTDKHKMASTSGGKGYQDSDVVTEVPEMLKKLVKFVSRKFYGPEFGLIIDMLVRNPCMKEEDLVELIKLDRKQLRICANAMKQDKLLKVRVRVETDTQGRTTRHNYFFIDYKMLVNVCKYKLDHIRRRCETEERDATSRASFRCTACEKPFTDLDVNQLFCPVSQMFLCSFCKMEVIEEASSLPMEDTRSLLSKFNAQIEPLYFLLRNVEDIRLAPSILEPEPSDVSYLTRRAHGSKSSKENKELWSGEASKGVKFGASEVQISVNAETESVVPQTQKERPIWMTESTISGPEPEPIKSAGASSMDISESAPAPIEHTDDDIMRTLLAHEKKSSNVPIPTAPDLPAAAASDRESDTSEEEMDIPGPPVPPAQPENAANAWADPNINDNRQIASDDEDEQVMVNVNGVRMPFHEVTDAHIKTMNPEEKAIFVKIGQELYDDMHGVHHAGTSSYKQG
ncbi:unnamed protein product [Owenia fusiformis]|uniref:HTH TFE/IIEalpha-type domain-containing protein n=1 Tax=Owenia fusiformis TaxID=6347 RepID=A0A8S4P1B6_OWEFU|nr:unnamed protein product [Owenia fusiformis]